MWFFKYSDTSLTTRLPFVLLCWANLSNCTDSTVIEMLILKSMFITLATMMIIILSMNYGDKLFIVLPYIYSCLSQMISTQQSSILKTESVSYHLCSECSLTAFYYIFWTKIKIFSVTSSIHSQALLLAAFQFRWRCALSPWPAPCYHLVPVFSTGPCFVSLTHWGVSCMGNWHMPLLSPHPSVYSAVFCWTVVSLEGVVSIHRVELGCVYHPSLFDYSRALRKACNCMTLTLY